ncbi:uncharacterized protein zgc:113276 [Lampris incognitus]|uniref:uncharacterized protein zgc:113276 n=1 Tax=Lampris incognitus TaxID=2546036 RepID=UPI0024B61033|nr:uncharacterized protein zgc:113276 [Lampris incognitus]
MVVLDVVIIGGGPHALTLASLLSIPYPEPNSDPACGSTFTLPERPQPKQETSKTTRTRNTNRRRAKASKLTKDIKHHKGMFCRLCCQHKLQKPEWHIYLQADVLPHMARLSKIFQKENVNFLAIKEQVPVTKVCLRTIRDAADEQPPGSFLARIHEDLDDPAGLGAFNITDEKERQRRNRGLHCQPVEDQQVPLVVTDGVFSPPLSLRVVDSYGEWTTLWESQFTALNIPHLRSHTLVHTDPFNKKALQEFVVKHDRKAELHSLPDQIYIQDDDAFFNDMRLGKKEKRRLNITTALKKNLSFSLPGTKLSVDFFKEQVERYSLDRVLVKGTVDSIIPVMEDEKEQEEENNTLKYFQVQLQEGITLKAHQVVMATGPTRAQMANIPPWVSCIGESYPEERMQHTVHLMHHPAIAQKQHEETDDQRQIETPTPVCHPGQRVMVIGGGLTSAHVVSIALQQGASHVTWVMRKHLQLKQFDVGDVESLVGRYSHVEHGIKMDGRAYLQQFYNERSLHRRLAMIRQARKGGAVTPEAYVHLQPFIQSGMVDVKAYCQVNDAKWYYRTQTWSLSLSNGDNWTGDMIWLATGCKLDVNQDPLLSGVMKEYPIQVIDGWPCITESLQWAPGCPLYLMGQYAALQIGPHAVNLAGGQAASMRIAKDIMRWHQKHNGKSSEETWERLKTDEYIQQMHGLMWL